MGLFAKLFGGKEAGGNGGAGGLREYIDGNLPKNYVQSKKYKVEIQEAGGRSAARVTLDMLADGSDYSGFGDADYAQLAEMESGYLLTGCLDSPPVAADFTLELVFGGGRVVTVEKRAGESGGILTDRGQRREISF